MGFLDSLKNVLMREGRTDEKVKPLKAVTFTESTAVPAADTIIAQEADTRAVQEALRTEALSFMSQVQDALRANAHHPVDHFLAEVPGDLFQAIENHIKDPTHYPFPPELGDGLLNSEYIFSLYDEEAKRVIIECHLQVGEQFDDKKGFMKTVTPRIALNRYVPVGEGLTGTNLEQTSFTFFKDFETYRVDPSCVSIRTAVNSHTRDTHNFFIERDKTLKSVIPLSTLKSGGDGFHNYAVQDRAGEVVETRTGDKKNILDEFKTFADPLISELNNPARKYRLRTRNYL